MFRLFKFLVSGGTAALIEYSVFLILDGIGVHLVIANSVSFICGLLVSYILNRLWVFSSRAAVKRQFFIYVLLAGINFSISNIMILLLVDGLNISSPFAKIMIMVTIASWNYILFSKIIFKNKS